MFNPKDDVLFLQKKTDCEFRKEGQKAGWKPKQSKKITDKTDIIAQ